jgi:hypothetical protein
VELTGEILLAPFLFACEVMNMPTYLELLQKNLVDEIEATRSYAATMAVAPQGDIPVLLELLADETDHIAHVAQLISQQTGDPVDYSALVSGVE